MSKKTQEEIIQDIAQSAYDMSPAILPCYPGALSEKLSHEALKEFRRELVRESIERFIRLSQQQEEPAPSKTGPTPRRNPSYETNYNENYTRRNRGEEVESVIPADSKCDGGTTETPSSLTEDRHEDCDNALLGCKYFNCENAEPHSHVVGSLQESIGIIAFGAAQEALDVMLDDGTSVSRRIREIVRTEIEATKIYETVWKDTPTYQNLSKRTGTPEIRENLKLVPTADTNVRAE